MKIGISTYTKFNLSVKEFLDFVSQLNLDPVELKLDDVELIKYLTSSSIDDLLKTLSRYDFKYLVHAPYIGVNLSIINNVMGKAAVKVMEKTLQLASYINAEIVTIHVGRFSKDYPLRYLSLAVEKAVSRLKKIVKEAENIGVTVSVENSHKAEDVSIAAFPEQIEYIVQRTSCRFTYDIGHANTFTDPSIFIDQLGEYIVNVHIHDNNGERDEHKVVGDGNINFKLILNKLKRLRYNGPMVIEVHSLRDIERSVEAISKLLKT